MVVACWHPEVIRRLSEAEALCPLPTMTIIKIALGVACWHPEEIPWLSQAEE